MLYPLTTQLLLLRLLLHVCCWCVCFTTPQLQTLGTLKYLAEKGQGAWAIASNQQTLVKLDQECVELRQIIIRQQQPDSDLQVMIW